MRPFIHISKEKILICILSASYQFLCGQDAYENEQTKIYQENITKEEINGVYIPKDVFEAFDELNRLSTVEGRNRLMEGKEEEIRRTLIFGLGKWMIVNWNFYEGSRLSHNLKQMGISLPDDMADFLIVSYYRHLKDLPLELEERAQAIYQKRKAEQEKRNKSKIVINH